MKHRLLYNQRSRPLVVRRENASASSNPPVLTTRTTVQWRVQRETSGRRTVTERRGDMTSQGRPGGGTEVRDRDRAGPGPSRTETEPDQDRAGPGPSRTETEPDQDRAGPRPSRTGTEPDRDRAGPRGPARTTRTRQQDALSIRQLPVASPP
ncbi:hypothetical protein EYF80_024214 [Liparis tanakae]|uniref:Uncharacterized protein n=1 Tax=Liparis tanakae TaxID=230148 RepID=A0A4Z2HIC0_9TELE|nr:hypothetical protein EYF80_024214 [Liparis tanakae]